MPQLMSEIEAMTHEDKLAAMDLLWTSILSNAEGIEPPAWHEAVLKERRRRAESGEETFIPWEEAKRSLRAEFARGSRALRAALLLALTFTFAGAARRVF